MSLNLWKYLMGYWSPNVFLGFRLWVNTLRVFPFLKSIELVYLHNSFNTL